LDRQLAQALAYAKPRRRVPATGKIGEMFGAHRGGRVSDLAFHHEGHVLCSVGGDGALRVWAQCYPDADYENLFELRQLPMRLQAEVTVAFDGNEGGVGENAGPPGSGGPAPMSMVPALSASSSFSRSTDFATAGGDDDDDLPFF
jgi:hypothetical protein